MLDGIDEHLRKHPLVKGGKQVLATMVCAPRSDFSEGMLAEISQHPEYTEAKCDCCRDEVVYQSGNVQRIMDTHKKAYPDFRCVITTICIQCGIALDEHAQKPGNERWKSQAVVGNRAGSPEFRAFEKAVAEKMGVEYIDPLQNN
jgi:hypothetical protein